MLKKTCILLLSWLLWHGDTALAKTERYGAIAFSPLSGQHGDANDQAGMDVAKTWARERCEAQSPLGGCEDILWFRESCGSLAVGDDGGYGAAWDTDKGRARAEALGNCMARTTGCRVVRALCNGEAEVAEALPMAAHAGIRDVLAEPLPSHTPSSSHGTSPGIIERMAEHERFPATTIIAALLGILLLLGLRGLLQRLLEHLAEQRRRLAMARLRHPLFRPRDKAEGDESVEATQSKPVTVEVPRFGGVVIDLVAERRAMREKELRGWLKSP